MNPDDVIEAFVATILLIVFIMLIAELHYPDLGDSISNALPGIVEFIAYIFIIALFGSIVWEMATGR